MRAENRSRGVDAGWSSPKSFASSSKPAGSRGRLRPRPRVRAVAPPPPAEVWQAPFHRAPPHRANPPCATRDSVRVWTSAASRAAAPDGVERRTRSVVLIGVRGSRGEALQPVAGRIEARRDAGLLRLDLRDVALLLPNLRHVLVEALVRGGVSRG